MRVLSITLAAIFCAFPLFAQEKPLHGIDVSDIDRKVSPCQDFYEFANGEWRAKNPIPPSMVIWSKRWAAGESTKEVLHGILEDAAAHAAADAPKSTDRLIGDYYGACMDEKQIDALVNNAGVGSWGALEELSMEFFRTDMETNYFGTVRCIKAVTPSMRKRRSGTIINVTSVAGKLYSNFHAPYCSSKATTEAMSEALSQELIPYNVRVALVEPGIIETPIFK